MTRYATASHHPHPGAATTSMSGPLLATAALITLCAATFGAITPMPAPRPGPPATPVCLALRPADPDSSWDATAAAELAAGVQHWAQPADLTEAPTADDGDRRLHVAMAVAVAPCSGRAVTTAAASGQEPR